MNLPYGIESCTIELRRKALAFRTTRVHTRKLPFYVPDCDGMDIHGKVWFTIRNQVIELAVGYAWNGCSPKWYGFGLLLGTPDFYDTVIESMWHDVFFQFSDALRSHVTLLAVNDMFARGLRSRKFVLAPIYKKAVYTFGACFWGVPDANVRVEFV